MRRPTIKGRALLRNHSFPFFNCSKRKRYSQSCPVISAGKRKSDAKKTSTFSLVASNQKKELTSGKETSIFMLAALLESERENSFYEASAQASTVAQHFHFGVSYTSYLQCNDCQKLQACL